MSGAVATPAARRSTGLSKPVRFRIVAAAIVLVSWQALAWSGLFYRGVIPPLETVAAALAAMLADRSFWPHLATTSAEVAAALVIGGLLGAASGVAVGGGLARRAYEPALHYLAPTPKIVFLPILIAFFGVGPGSKVAMGALSCFFPMALSVASGMAQINPVHRRVARSFGLSRRQVLTKVVLPSLIPALATGLRLGLGVAVIGCVLSEIKLSNRGLGFLAIQYYGQFRIPQMYSVLIVLFGLAGGANALLGRVRRPGARATA
jgi:ABC-type nitrate/sulfonate/bicarbonate transport system permease component